MKFPKYNPTGIGTTGATGIVLMTLHLTDIPLVGLGLHNGTGE